MPIKTKGIIPRAWRWIKRIFLFLFFLQFFYILILKWVNPPVTITQMSSLFHGYGLKRDYVSINEISPYARLAVISSEDQTFPDHDGFDFKSIEKAMKHNQKSKSRHGASTISQQVAKNVFLWQGGGFFRKGLEVYFTFMIELFWSKKRILQMYLNVSEMGKGVFGIEAAAKYYFNKHAKTLSRSESAMIAACLPNPKVFTVKPLSRHVAEKYPWILVQMHHLQDDPDIIKLLQ
ncbi:MAG TPA: monofunctional biosynthetic peptidoglycan transglycosylase [Puia sp.]